MEFGNEKKTTTLFKIALKNKKKIRYKSTKYIYIGFISGNYKTLVKELKDLNSLYWWIRILSIIKMSVMSNFIYRSMQSQSQSQWAFLLILTDWF